jgi:Protein kinase domain
VAHRAIGPGDLVASRFRLEDLLDDHSGALLWRATDLILARNVAVHVIDADDPRSRAVLTAARTSATVTDGRILRVLDALQEGAFVHVVHEWGTGESLDRLLVGEPLDPRRAAWLVREVAEAVTVAHRHGIAHGRLLPENVMLTDAGSVKLVGFVVDAVLHGRHRRQGDDREPPGEHESDVTNLGALLYASLTGRWPGFPQSKLPDAPLNHGRICRPRQVRPGVPKPLDLLCDQILNPDERGGRRFESAGQISAVLGDYLGEVTGTPVTVSGPTIFLDRGSADDADHASGVVDPHPTAPAIRPVEEAGGDEGDGEPTDPAAEPVREPVLGADGWPAAGAPSAGPVVVPAAAPVVGRSPVDAWSATPHRPGGVPEHWGPDHVDDPGPWPPVHGDERPGAPWMRLAAIVAVAALVLLAVVVAFALGNREAADEPPPSATPTPSEEPPPEELTVARVQEFDPDDPGGGENPEQAPLATDGDPATAWQTQTYFDGPVLAPYRSGVGLTLDLGEAVEVSEVQVTLLRGPYDLQLLAAPEAGGAPTAVDGLDTLDTRSGVSSQVTLEAEEPVTARYLVIWLTALAPTDGGFKGGIAEVTVRP